MWRWLLEEIGKHLGLEGLKWLLKQPFVVMGIDLTIWAWMLALPVILVVVVIACFRAMSLSLGNAQFTGRGICPTLLMVTAPVIALIVVQRGRNVALGQALFGGRIYTPRYDRTTSLRALTAVMILG